MGNGGVSGVSRRPSPPPGISPWEVSKKISAKHKALSTRVSEGKSGCRLRSPNLSPTSVNHWEADAPGSSGGSGSGGHGGEGVRMGSDHWTPWGAHHREQGWAAVKMEGGGMARKPPQVEKQYYGGLAPKFNSPKRNCFPNISWKPKRRDIHLEP